ncbi:MAG TPA: ferritin-like domain-containing protein [Planctomycetota bacterium]|nr:ferritin-like domain-containing protein [Planctomycetota bacterium]
MAEDFDRAHVLKLLDVILEDELAGVVRYTHYSFMVFGFHRIPITSWLRKQAEESLAHAQEAGELITHFGGHPSLSIGSLLESHKHDLGDILRESLEHEKKGLDNYRRLLAAVEGGSVLLEEYARRMIEKEDLHIGEVDKMLRAPGMIGSMRGGAGAAGGAPAKGAAGKGAGRNGKR